MILGVKEGWKRREGRWFQREATSSALLLLSNSRGGGGTGLCISALCVMLSVSELDESVVFIRGLCKVGIASGDGTGSGIGS
jgi:hypothetical protein